MSLHLKLTILHRLIISYLVIIILVIISGSYTILKLSGLNRIMTTMVTDSAMIRLSGENLNIMYAFAAAEEKFLISRDPDYRRQYEESQAIFYSKLLEMKRNAHSGEQQSLVSGIMILYDQAMDISRQISISKGQGRNNLTDILGHRTKIMDAIDKKLSELSRISARDRDDKLRLSKVISDQITNTITITVIISIILVVFLSLFNTKSISAPIKLLREKTKQIAAGDFGLPLRITSPPEMKELSDAFDVMCNRLQELDQMKLDFISHLSHELRTPLTVIQEASSMLRDGRFSVNPEKEQELFIIVEEECRRLIHSVNRILDLSRMEAGMADFSFQALSIYPIVERNILRFSPIAGRKNIEMVLDLPEDLPVVSMDMEKIGEVVENLLGNALKFTPEGGRIVVSGRYHPGDENLEVSVSDNGPGIPAEGLKEVFEKFKRVEDKKGAVRGTGLGLAIAKHIIDAHGGRIWVKSRLGEGSTFFFSLPSSS